MNRFTTEDPHPGDKDDSLSLNQYLYVANNPINFTDPDGDVKSPVSLFSDWLYARGYGDAAAQLYQDSKAWRFVMDHPYVSSVGVGLTAGLAAYSGAAGAKAALNVPAVRKVVNYIRKNLFIGKNRDGTGYVVRVGRIQYVGNHRALPGEKPHTQQIQVNIKAKGVKRWKTIVRW